MIDFVFHLNEEEQEDKSSIVSISVDPIDESKCSDIEAMIGLYLCDEVINKFNHAKELLTNNKDEFFKEFENIKLK